MYFVKGANGQIRLTEKRVIISREGMMGVLQHGTGQGKKEIPIKNITAVQFLDAKPLANGYIQFSIVGSVESKGTKHDAKTDENTVMFSAAQTAEFQEIKRYVDAVIDGETIDFNSLQLPKESDIQAAQAAVAAAKQEKNQRLVDATKGKKTWNTAMFLSILLGGFGADRFYLGYTGMGIAKLLTAGGCGIWWIVDIIMIATGKVQDSSGNDLVKMHEIK